MKIEYAINRYAMETKRLFDVLDKQLEGRSYICGEQYTIADMAVFPWIVGFVEGMIYGTAAEFLQVKAGRHDGRQFCARTTRTCAPGRSASWHGRP